MADLVPPLHYQDTITSNTLATPIRRLLARSALLPGMKGSDAMAETPREERTPFARVLVSDVLADNEIIFVSTMSGGEVQRAIVEAEARGEYPTDADGRVRWYAQLLVDRGYATKVRVGEPERIEGAWRG